MKKEIEKAMRSAEDVGDGIFDMTMLAPAVLKDSLELGRDIVGIPWSVLKGTSEFAAEKVDDTVDMVV